MKITIIDTLMNKYNGKQKHKFMNELVLKNQLEYNSTNIENKIQRMPVYNNLYS